MITANANTDMGPQAKDTATDYVEKRRKYLPYSVFPLKRPYVIIFLIAFHLKVTVYKFAGIIRARVLFKELNDFKSNEMDVHENNRHLTRQVFKEK